MTSLPVAAKGFVFESVAYDEGTGQLRLNYGVGGISVCELLCFPEPPTLNSGQRRALTQASTMLHLLAGVSYYKVVAGVDIQLNGPGVSAAWANFLNATYIHGLAEFALQNGLSLDTAISFPSVAGGSGAEAESLSGTKACLVAMGGGKDSLLAVELLRAAGRGISLCYVGSSPVIARVAEATGLPAIAIGRQLAPELLEWNRMGAKNGHVPVSAINSAILVCAAIIYGFGRVVFANERSADEPTRVDDDGALINHQYSKSLAFEREFSRLVTRDIATDLHYFSILRPWFELGICKQFASISRYDSVFTSCNRNFHLAGTQIDQRWCQKCPKCQFVFLALAPFMPKSRLLNIFGANILDDSTQCGAFKALLGLGEGKPFECVGTIDEANAALYALSQRQEWCKDSVVASYLAGWDGVDHLPERALDSLCKPGGEDLVPDDLRRALAL